METDVVRFGNILVAGVAADIRRVGYQTYVSRFLVFYTTVTAVTDNAASRAVGALHKLGITQEDLFPYLQRR